ECDGLVITGKRFGRPMQLLQRDAAIVDRVRVIAIDPQRGVDLRQCGLVLAALRMDNTQEMQAAEMVRLLLQDPPVKFFGLAQPASLVKPDGLIEPSRCKGLMGRPSRRLFGHAALMRKFASYSRSKRYAVIAARRVKQASGLLSLLSEGGVRLWCDSSRLYLH